MTTYEVQVRLDDSTYQTAANRAARAGKSLGQVVADFLTQYADGAEGGALTTYTVQRGDTLGRIAAKFYRNARKYPIIARANNIANPSRIWIGQVLVIPALDGQSTSPPPTPVPTPTPPPAPVPTTPVSPPEPTSPQLPPPPVSGGKPAKPSIRWVGSPNFNNRRRPDDISAIVIHSTANSSLNGVISWFNNPSAQVSAHYTVGKDGQIVQHVQDMHRAWHAGRSTWQGRDNTNDYAIGIEMVNLNDGRDPYTEAQYRAVVALSAYLAAKYEIDPDDIMGHLDIAIPPGRKSDPRGFDLERLRRDVAAHLGR